MKILELIENLHKYPLFTIGDLTKITGQPATSVRIVASRLVKRRVIKRIERNKYTFHDEPLIFASYIIYPSYIGLWAALRFHNLTTQIVREIDVIVPKSRKDLIFMGNKIHFTKTRNIWGFYKGTYLGFEIFISDIEKTIIDCILSGVQASVILEAIKTGPIDEDKLFEYTAKVNSFSLFKRLGFILEKAGFDTQRYVSKIDNHYIKLNPSGREKGVLNKKWKIIENEAII